MFDIEKFEYIEEKTHGLFTKAFMFLLAPKLLGLIYPISKDISEVF